MKNGVRLRDPIPRGLRALACLLLALCLTLPCAPSRAASRDGFGVIYGTDTLNLRSRGSSSSEWLGAYARGTWVEIWGQENNFYYVRTPDGRAGYMSKNFIDATGDEDVLGYGQTWEVAVVTNQNGGKFLNFRQSPSYSSKVLGIFYDGVPLYVQDTFNGWVCVLLNGQTGYVREEYVTTTVQVASSVVATIKTPNNTKINLRNGPGTDYGVVRQIAGDRYVMVLAEGNGWWRVSIDGYVGFMSNDFLVKGLESAKDIAARSGGGGTGDAYAVVRNPKSTQALNLRRYASTGSEVLTKLYNGAKLWVDVQGKDWCAVTEQDTGVGGYVMTKYLRLYNLPSTPKRAVYHPNGSYVNLRSDPDMAYGEVLVRVPTGKSVTVLAPGAEWYRVQYGSTVGYMLSYFLP